MLYLDSFFLIFLMTSLDFVPVDYFKQFLFPLEEACSCGYTQNDILVSPYIPMSLAQLELRELTQLVVNKVNMLHMPQLINRTSSGMLSGFVNCQIYDFAT
jgi:hypothetical protein